jgi:hypothetical protein
MGFCFYNNVAAAAWVATRLWGLQRVLVLDWDVHHGVCALRWGPWQCSLTGRLRWRDPLPGRPGGHL